MPRNTSLDDKKLEAAMNNYAPTVPVPKPALPAVPPRQTPATPSPRPVSASSGLNTGKRPSQGQSLVDALFPTALSAYVGKPAQGKKQTFAADPLAGSGLVYQKPVVKKQVLTPQQLQQQVRDLSNAGDVVGVKRLIAQAQQSHNFTPEIPLTSRVWNTLSITNTGKDYLAQNRTGAQKSVRRLSIPEQSAQINAQNAKNARNEALYSNLAAIPRNAGRAVTDFLNIMTPMDKTLPLVHVNNKGWVVEPGKPFYEPPPPPEGQSITHLQVGRHPFGGEDQTEPWLGKTFGTLAGNMPFFFLGEAGVMTGLEKMVAGKSPQLAKLAAAVLKNPVALQAVRQTMGGQTALTVPFAARKAQHDPTATRDEYFKESLMNLFVMGGAGVAGKATELGAAGLSPFMQKTLNATAAGGIGASMGIAYNNGVVGPDALLFGAQGLAGGLFGGVSGPREPGLPRLPSTEPLRRGETSIEPGMINSGVPSGVEPLRRGMVPNYIHTDSKGVETPVQVVSSSTTHARYADANGKIKSAELKRFTPIKSPVPANTPPTPPDTPPLSGIKESAIPEVSPTINPEPFTPTHTWKIRKTGEEVPVVIKSQNASDRAIVVDANGKQHSGVVTSKLTPVEKPSVPPVPDTTGRTVTPETPQASDTSPVITTQPGGQFHGTSEPIDKVGFSYDRQQAQNLYSPGFYTSNDLSVVAGSEGNKGYSQKGKGKNPTVYKVEWTGDHPVQLIDLEKPITDARARGAIEQATGETFDFSKPGKEVYAEIKQRLAENGLTRDAAQEVMDSITSNLTDVGYDGFSHVGGKGDKTHHVEIYFNPVDEYTGQENIKVTKVNPDNFGQTVLPETPLSAPTTPATPQAEAAGGKGAVVEKVPANDYDAITQQVDKLYDIMSPKKNPGHEGAIEADAQAEQLKTQLQQLIVKDLPSLEGTEKQVPWATDIRNKLLGSLGYSDITGIARRFSKESAVDLPEATQRIRDAVKELRNYTVAGDWINWRDKGLTNVLISDAFEKLQSDNAKIRAKEVTTPAPPTPPAAPGAGTEKLTGTAGGASAVTSTAFPPQSLQARVAARAEVKSQLVDTSVREANKFIDDFVKSLGPGMRGPTARVMKGILRSAVAEMAHKNEQARVATLHMVKAFNKLTTQAQLQFMFDFEGGRPQPTPGLQKFADTMRTMIDKQTAEVQATGKLQQFIENYLGHLWKDPQGANSVLGMIFGKRPLEGSKGFLKQRTIPTIEEGMSWRVVDKNGDLLDTFKTEAEATARAGANGFVKPPLELVTNNPVELMLLKMHEINRYLMGHKVITELKTRGLATFVQANGEYKPPKGSVKVDDIWGAVMHPNTNTTREAFDEVVMKKLNNFASSLGINVNRSADYKGPKKEWGRAIGTDTVNTRTGGPETVLTHEIGHILGNRYNLYEWLTQKGTKMRVGGVQGARKAIAIELRALADLRVEDPKSMGKGTKSYIRKAAEKEANLVHAYVFARDTMREVAPVTLQAFEKFINLHPELKPLRDIKPSLVLGSRSETLQKSGMVLEGNYYLPEPAALIMHNYLSPGLRGDWKYDIVRKIGNTMNQAQLGISAFHLGFTTFDATISKAALGAYKISRGDVGEGFSDIFKAIVPGWAPIENFQRGDRLLKAYQSDIDQIQDPVMRDIVYALVQGGGRVRMDSFYRNNAVTDLGQSFRNMREEPGFRKLLAAGDASLKVIPAIMEGSSKWLMEDLVPRQKLGVFMDMAQYELKKLPADATPDMVRERMGTLWDSVDNRMGQMVYDNLFWNKTFKDVMMLGVRSLGWNLGTIRELGGAGYDLATTGARMKAGEGVLSHRMAYAIALPMMTGLWAATYQYIRTGKGPEELKDYVFPKTGRKTASGDDERVAMATYMKDVYAWGHDPLTTAGNKVHPLLGMISDMVANEDYFGTKIRNEDDLIVQQGIQLASYFGQTFMPFSVRNSMKMLQEGDKAGAAQAFVGITPAPGSVIKTEAEKLIQRYIGDKLGTRTSEQANNSRELAQLRVRARRGEDVHVEINKRYRAGKMTLAQVQQFGKDIHLNPRVISFKGLAVEQALRVLKVANPEEKKLWRGVAMVKFRNGVKNTAGPTRAELISLAKDAGLIPK